MKSCVTNLQKTVSVNVPLLEENVARIKRAMRVEKFDVSVWLRSDKMVQKMNKRDRLVDAPTDVLSYSFQVRLLTHNAA
jgi:ssRNA-specific RNase YbeY (16S rRNA maturation enzyme)